MGNVRIYWLDALEHGAANASEQQAAVREIERLRTRLDERCPGDCPGRLKFHAAKENGE